MIDKQEELKRRALELREESKALRPRADLADQLEGAIGRLLTKMTQDLPAPVQAVLKKLSTHDQIDWLRENASGRAAPPGTASPTMNTNAMQRNRPGAPRMSDEEYLARKRASEQYRGL
jgi:hypothetical protein